MTPVPESQPAASASVPAEKQPMGLGRDGLIMVVADAELYSRLNLLANQSGPAGGVDSPPPPPTAYAPGWLAALGALGQPDAAKPQTIIGPVSAMSGMAPGTVNALAELTPQTRIVLLSDADSTAVAQRAKNANPACEIWTGGVNDEVLLPLLGAHTRPAPGASATPPAAERNAAVVPPPASVSTAASSKPLGDTDLVDAVMTGGGRLRETALKLIEQQSGLVNARLLEAEANPDESQGLRIGSFGLLTADNVQSLEQLAVWRDWLNQWLTLNKQMHTMTALAMRDELTDVWNRRYFNRFLKRILQRAAEKRLQVTVMVFDIDDFKTYNDKYGHAAGDEILIETARLMNTVVREHDVVARIGGDEFAVIFWETQEAPEKAKGRNTNSRHPDNVMAAANRFQKAICQHRFTKLAEEAPGALTISGGIATYPWDGRTPDELVEVADQMAYKSKQQGKNAITYGPGVHRQRTSS